MASQRAFLWNSLPNLRTFCAFGGPDLKQLAKCGLKAKLRTATPRSWVSWNQTTHS